MPRLRLGWTDWHKDMPATRSLRRDPRFWTWAEHNGLVGYWRARKVRPDFCSEPDMAAECDRRLFGG